MRRIYRLKDPLRVIQEQSRPIRWFPLVSVSLPGFIYLAFSLLLILLIFLCFAAPARPGECVRLW
jgi:hypothetical protein